MGALAFVLSPNKLHLADTLLLTNEEVLEEIKKVRRELAGRLDATFDRRESSRVLDPMYLHRLTSCKYVRIYGRINWTGTLVLIATPILFILTGFFLSWWLVPLAVVPVIAFVRIRDRIKDRAMAEVVMGNRGLFDSLMQRDQMRVVGRQK